MADRYTLPRYKLWNLADRLSRPETVWSLLEMGCLKTARRELLREFFRELFPAEPWIPSSFAAIPGMLEAFRG